MDQKCNACGKARDVKDMWLAPDGENYCNHISCYQVGVDREVNYLRRRAETLLSGIEGLLQTIQDSNVGLLADFTALTKPYLIGYLKAIITNGREE